MSNVEKKQKTGSDFPQFDIPLPKDFFEPLDFQPLKDMMEILSQFEKDSQSVFYSNPRIPRIKGIEEDKEYQIEIDIPDISSWQIDVTIEERKVIIRGKREKNKDKKKKGEVISSEMGSSQFYQKIVFGKEVNLNNITTDSKNDVWILHIPKKQKKKKKRIKLKK